MAQDIAPRVTVLPGKGSASRATQPCQLLMSRLVGEVTQPQNPGTPEPQNPRTGVTEPGPLVLQRRKKPRRVE